MLANGTDVPLDRPSREVEQWNRGELGDFPSTGSSASVHPPDAQLEDGQYIEDAYVAVFAVQPSTRARLSASASPLYVPQNGSVLGTIDYRVDPPPNEDRGDWQVTWSVSRHRVEESRLLVDGDLESKRVGGRTPTLVFTDLDGYDGETHTLTIEADIFVEVRRHVRDTDRHCRTTDDGVRSCWTTVDHDYDYYPEEITVRDSIQVEEYDLAVAGSRAVYPNGDLGVVVYKTVPWLGYSLPDGEVNGVWRFYSARDPGWDTLVRETESGRSTEHSPLHPLQITAYPIETGPTAHPRKTVEILAVYGVEVQPGALPETVRLDVLEEPYTASYGIVTRSKTDDYDLSSITAHGLVRGERVTPQEEHFFNVPINRSTLSISVLNETTETVTVRIRLEDADTGTPITTDGRNGYVVVDRQRVNTSNNGSVEVTLPNRGGGVSARYEPGEWWLDYPGYVGDTAVVSVGGTAIELISTLYRLGVPISLFLFAAFLIDRFTGWGVWPPWRKL